MKKRMMESFLLWLFFLLMSIAVTFFANSIYGLAVIAVWTILPVITWGMNFYIRRKLKVKLIVTPTAVKRAENQITLIWENESILAAGKAFCQLEFHNTLTGEKQLHTLEIPLKAKGSSRGVLQMVSAHCGYIRITLRKTVVTDCFGFLPLNCLLTAIRKIDVLPDMFQTQVSLQLHSVATDEALTWSQEKKGDDYTELFALRDYVEGDSMKQIHWKLSSKKNTLIIKEASLPTTKSLLLFWDKNTSNVTAEEMDAMAEVVTSVSQAIMEMGILFTLGWTEGQSCVFEEIENEDCLIQVLPHMLKTGAEPGEDSLVTEVLQNRGMYGKKIYFAKIVPEYIAELQKENMTLVLCDAEGVEGACTFAPETYMQDMAVVEL